MSVDAKGLEAARKAVGTIPGAWLWSDIEKAIEAYLAATSPAGDLVDRARFLAAGQDDPHSQTIIELCDALEALRYQSNKENNN